MIRETLENGLTVIVDPLPCGVVTVDAWVAVGAADEDDAQSGLSHFLEHMMFKGTEHYGPGELDRMVTAAGGMWNAGTARDFTHYHATVPAPFFETALGAVAELVQRPLLPRDEVDRERAVIIEEIRRKQDQPSGVLWDDLYAAACAGTPHARSVLGTEQTVGAISADQLTAHFHRFYAPTNTTLIVGGDVDPGEAHRLVSASFSEWNSAGALLADAGAAADTTNATTRRPACPRRLSRTMATTQLYVAFAWPVPKITDLRTATILDIAATVLGAGRGSRYYRIIKEERRLADTIGCHAVFHRGPGLMAALATRSAAENPRPLVAAVAELAAGLATDPPSPAEMKRARNLAKADFLFGAETTDGRTGSIGHMRLVSGSDEWFGAYPGLVDGVTSDDVADVASRLLSTEPCLAAVGPAETVSGLGTDITGAEESNG